MSMMIIVDAQLKPESVSDATESRFVAIGAGLSVARDARHDQLLVDGRESVVPDPPPLERPRLEALGRDIAHGGEPLEKARAFGLPQIERDRLLVACLAQPNQTVPTLRHRAQPSTGVADLRQLDLDHFRAELGQNRRAIRRCDIGP